MIFTAFLMFLSVLLAGLTVLAIAFFILRREKQRLMRTIKLYFEPAGPEQLSQFAQITEAISRQFASAAVASVKGTIMGMNSVDSKNQKKLEADFTMDLVNQQMPLLGAFMAQFPSVAKRIQKNPELLPLVQQFASKLSNGGSLKMPVENHDNGHSTFTGVY